MPLLSVNLSLKTYSDIMTLVAKGGYAGPEQFLEIAAFNQLALERGLTAGELAKGIREPASAMPQATPPLLARLPEEDRSEPETVKRSPTRVSTAERRVAAEVGEDEIGETLARFSLDASLRLKLAPCSLSKGWTSERIWGQVNRLFPAKAACRWIAVAGATENKWPELDLILTKTSNDASILGTALEHADTQHGRKREELAATGLPRKGSLQSSDRFASQFIARVTRANRVFPGAIAQYGLACFEGGCVQLTPAGVELASLKNPILDSEFGTSGRTLSDEEREAILRHIWLNVPAEKQDFEVVINAVGGGAVKPDGLMATVRHYFPGDWSEVAFRTHIYGVFARLTELGALTKQWDGRTVEYQISKTAGNLVRAN